MDAFPLCTSFNLSFVAIFSPINELFILGINDNYDYIKDNYDYIKDNYYYINDNYDYIKDNYD